MSGNGFLRLLFRSEIRLHGNAGKSLPLSPVSPAERTRLRGAEAPQRKPRAAPAKAGSEGMSKRGFLRLLFRPEIRRHGDVGKKPPFVKGRCRRECRNEDFSGCCFARKYDGMGTSDKSLPLSKGGLEGMSKRGFLRLLLRPEIQLHGDAEKKASLCQREVWRECRNEDFSGCYFARKYNCMGTPKKKPPFVKGRFGGNVETRISPAVTSPGNTTAWGRRRNPTARGSCSPRSGGKAP